MQLNDNTIPGETQKPQAETVSELSHRHMADQNHEPTEEEIRNVDLELDTEVTANPELDPDVIEKKLKEKGQELPGELANPDRAITPTDILGKG